MPGREGSAVRDLVGVTLALFVLLSVAGPVGTAAAPHGAAANFTALPATLDDREPGISDASYKTWTKPPQDAEFRGFKYLSYSVLRWEAGTLGNCGPTDNEVFGIDRGDDDPGTEVDDSAQDNIEGFHSTEDKVVADFIDPEDPVGETIHLNVTDEFISSVTDCRGNPEQAGWYQYTGTINGTNWDGEHVERTTTSHYFWICECTSEAEARERLGPPPSEGGETATATPTDTPTPGPETTRSGGQTATETSSTDGTPTTSPTTTPTGTPTPTTATPTDRPGAETPTPTATAAAWAANTPSQGPGFGVLAALAAVVGLALLRRHTR